MKTRSADFFWPSYTDLMTSLFFLMLVLYVLALLSVKVNVADARFLREMEESVGALNGRWFTFEKDFKRFTLARQVRFPVGSDIIPREDDEFLEQAGRQLEEVIDRAKQYHRYDLKYLIAIEGMASRDRFVDNWGLSYRRALAVYRFWRSHGINFDPEICEVMISGSGVGGVGRDTVESNNQRILIQILPKTRARGF